MFFCILRTKRKEGLKSFLKPISKYRGEVYSMEIYTHGATVSIDMRIYGHGEFTGMYSAEYEIERAMGKRQREPS